MFVNDKGVIKQANDLYVNDKGVVKQVKEAWVNDKGVIKRFYILGAAGGLITPDIGFPDSVIDVVNPPTVRGGVAQMTLFVAGNWQVTAGQASPSAGLWHEQSPVPGTYEYFITLASGDPPILGNVIYDQWTPFTEDISFGYLSGGPNFTGTFDLQIRNAADNSEITSDSVYMRADGNVGPNP